jgi:AcrR family transcriptional regulator
MTEYSAGGDISASLSLLWHMGQRPTRGPKPGLTLDRIVEAAVRIADAEGLAAVSMRRVASELGVGTMSLYRYVPGKAELLDLMLDKVNECVDDEVLAGLDWRAHLETCARAGWRLYLAHPWLLQVDQSRPLLGPNALTGLEQYLRGIGGIGFTDQERIIVVATIDGLITGIARTYVNALQAEQRSGLSDEEFWAAQAPVLTKAMGTGDYPTMASLAEDTFSFSHEQLFAFGLERLLDGLGAFVERRAALAATTP